jgi:hypothetical protein
MVRACIWIGDVPLVHPPSHPNAGEVVKFPIRVPGAYTLTFGRPPRCVEFDIVVDANLRAKVTLVGLGGLHLAGVEQVPVGDDQRFRRAWDILFEEGGA